MTAELGTPIPRTLEGALDLAWLSEVLTPAANGAAVERVEIVEEVQVNQTVKATIVRFRAHFADGTAAALCLKGFLDRPDTKGNSAAVRESRFYADLANRISVRSPAWVAAPVDTQAEHGLLYMRDMVEQGAHFCSALEPFDAARAARSLEQLARLHTSHVTLGPVQSLDWTVRQIDWLAGYMKPEMLQGLLNDERAEGIPEEQRDATRLVEALKALSAVDAALPASLIHGDCHAGNIFETPEGAGLIDFQLLQQGGWALDVAYHIAATLPVELAEREERNLLRHYLETVKSLGGEVPGDEEAWGQYRKSPVYGYFLWAITRTVARPIINSFCERLSHSVARHDSYRLLGV